MQRKLKQFFEMQDADKSGEIATKECHCVLWKLGYYTLTDEEEIAEVVAVVDDNSGGVNFEEMMLFIKIYQETEGFTKKTCGEIDQVFQRFDPDASGLLHDLLFQFRRDNQLALVLVTHNLELAERADRILHLDTGRLHLRGRGQGAVH